MPERAGAIVLSVAKNGASGAAFTFNQNVTVTDPTVPQLTVQGTNPVASFNLTPDTIFCLYGGNTFHGDPWAILLPTTGMSPAAAHPQSGNLT